MSTATARYQRRERSFSEAAGDVLTSRWVFYPLALAFLVAVVVVSSKLLKGEFTRTDEQKTVDVVKNEIQPDKVHYSKGQFLTWANVLEEAMKGWGTTEDSIYAVFSKFYSDDDVKAQIAAFGIRYYEDKVDFGLSDADYDLGQWLETELSTSEKKKLNSILTSHGVTFQF